MNINVSNPIMKNALTKCLDVYDIKYKLKTNTLNITSKTNPLTSKSIDTINQNTGELFKDMKIMLYFLHETNHSIIYFSLNDIILIHNHYFFINQDKIVPMESNIITIEYPIQLDEFASVDLKIIEEVPFNVPIESCYYSLANILYYLYLDYLYIIQEV